MKSLQTILLDKDWDEPPEIPAIKSFIRNKFNESVKVSFQNNNIVIMARSSALAGTLRMHLEDIRQACETDKKLIIRIG